MTIAPVSWPSRVKTGKKAIPEPRRTGGRISDMYVCVAVMTAPIPMPWMSLPAKKHPRRPSTSFGRYETYIIATAKAEKKLLRARVRRRPILSCSHPPASEPAMAPIGEAKFQSASHDAGRIHSLSGPSSCRPKSTLRKLATPSHTRTLGKRTGSEACLKPTQ
jgi:hypothetical protein